jgi:MFS family permease
MDKQQLRRLVVSSLLGTALEAFDFIVYALLTPVAFNPLFFPQLDPAVATIASLSVFAVGILSRPLGGVVLGHFGDRVGRKPTMVITLSLMGVSTAAIGLIPTYATIGILAPIALAVLRFIQGFAYGGENSAAPIFVAESCPPDRRGFYTSLCTSGISIGVACSSLAVTMIAALPKEDMLAWGWRVPFIASLVVVIVGLYIRLKIEESPDFMAAIMSNRPFRAPIVEVLRRHKKPTLITLMVATGQSASLYFMQVFLLSYAIHDLKLPASTLTSGLLIGNVLAIFSTTFFGYLSDFVGRRVVMGGSFVLTALYVPLGMLPLLHTGDPQLIVLAMAVPGAVLASSSLGTSYTFSSEIFSDARIRFSGLALGKQVGNVLGAGLLPVISASIIASTGSVTWAIVLFVAVNLLAVTGVYMTAETKDLSFGRLSSAEVDEVDPGVPLAPAPMASAPHS